MSDHTQADQLRTILTRERKAREDAIAAILAMPEDAQRAIKRQLDQCVHDAKHDEAGDINYEGFRAQIEYLAEDGEAYPPECWAEMIEAAQKEVEKS